MLVELLVNCAWTLSLFISVIQVILQICKNKCVKVTRAITSIKAKLNKSYRQTNSDKYGKWQRKTLKRWIWPQIWCLKAYMHDIWYRSTAELYSIVIKINIHFNCKRPKLTIRAIRYGRKDKFLLWKASLLKTRKLYSMY